MRYEVLATTYTDPEDGDWTVLASSVESGGDACLFGRVLMQCRGWKVVRVVKVVGKRREPVAVYDRDTYPVGTVMVPTPATVG